jgi:hypothetical protein
MTYSTNCIYARNIANNGATDAIEDIIEDYPHETLSIADGTVTDPSLHFTDDTNSGIYRIGADNIGISLGGSKAVDLSSSGMVLSGNYSNIDVVADGVTDNHDIIRTAFASTSDIYKHIILPLGNVLYNAVDGDASNLAIGAKVIQGQGPQTILTIDMNALTGAKTIFSITNVVFKDMTINCVVPTAGGLTSFIFSVNGDGNTFQNLNGDGGLTYSSGNVVETSFTYFSFINTTVSNFNILNCKLSNWKAITFKANTNSTSTTNMIVDNNIFTDNLVWDVLINSPTGVCENIIVSNNIFLRENNDDSQADHSITMVNVTGCRVVNNTFRGYYSVNGALHSEEGAEFYVVSGNTFITDGSGISMITNNAAGSGQIPVKNTIICDNTFSAYSASVNAFRAIYLTSGNVENVQNFKIQNNIIKGDYEVGVAIDGLSVLDVQNNIFDSCDYGVRITRRCNSTVRNNIFRNITTTSIETSSCNVGYNTFEYNELASPSASEIATNMIDNTTTINNSMSIDGWQVQVSRTFTSGGGVYRVPISPLTTLLPQKISPFKMRFIIDMYQSSTENNSIVADAILTYSAGWTVASAVDDNGGTGNFIHAGTTFVIVNDILYFQTTSAYNTGFGIISIKYQPKDPLQILETSITAGVGDFGMVFEDTVNDEVVLSTSGVERMAINSSSVDTSVRSLNVDGTALLPAYSFTNDPNSGVYSNGADDVGIATGGSIALSVNDNNASFSRPIVMKNTAISTTPYTILATDQIITASSSADVFNLPAGTAMPLQQLFIINNTASTLSAVNRAGSDTIGSGALTTFAVATGGGVMLMSDGRSPANWIRVDTL